MSDRHCDIVIQYVIDNDIVIEYLELGSFTAVALQFDSFDFFES